MSGVTNVGAARGQPALAILPFWDDIDADTGDVYWEVQGTAPNRMVDHRVVQPAALQQHRRRRTFEVILYEGTNEIKFQYADVDFGNASYNNGASATVGINKDATPGGAVLLQPGA